MRVKGEEATTHQFCSALMSGASARHNGEVALGGGGGSDWRWEMTEGMQASVGPELMGPKAAVGC
jgi:hypothetical protein